MLTSTPTRTRLSPVHVAATERPSFTELHLSVASPEEPSGSDPIGAALDSLAAVAAERRLEPIQEKLYGLASAHEEILAKRRVAWERHGLDASVPVTLLEGTPVGRGAFAGAQLWGVAAGPRASVRSIDFDGGARGRSFEGPGFRMVHLPSVQGTDAQGLLAKDPATQIDRTFANAKDRLHACGLSYGNVVRTWIYLARLLETYADLNRVRTAHYATVGFGTKPGDRPFPASTGIQGRHASEECLIDVLAVEGANLEVRPLLRSTRQNESFSYGSAFSRGMSLGIEERRTIHVSGTASIDPQGRTVHVGDREKQVVEMLLSIAALLEREGAGLQSLVSGTLFCKDRETYDAWLRVTRLLRVPALPIVPVVADVCRPELLVELEAVAVI